MWPWKWGQSLQNLISSQDSLNDIPMQVWWKSIYLLKRYPIYKTKTLKKRSRPRNLALNCHNDIYMQVWWTFILWFKMYLIYTEKLTKICKLDYDLGNRVNVTKIRWTIGISQKVYLLQVWGQSSWWHTRCINFLVKILHLNPPLTLKMK